MKGKKTMITIALFNNKGGCGKSTAVINIAFEIAKLGKRVMVADMDSQLNSFRFFAEKDSKTTYSGKTRYKNIDITCDKTCFIENYDYVIFDMPPALNDNTRRIISMCDYVFVPIELGTFSISGIANVTEAIAATGAKFGGCFVNKFDRNNPSDHALDELIWETLGSKAMSTKIPNSRVIKNSISYRLTAFEYMRWIDAAEAYARLTKEIIKICEGE